MYDHILIPTDGSDLSQRAIAAGIALAGRLGARVTGYFAAPPATPIIYSGFLPAGYAPPDEHARMIEETARQYLDVIVTAAREAGVPCEVLHTTSDFPAESILEIAHQRGCDMIFIASHGRRGWRGPVLGSQTYKVVCQSVVPVVVYRAGTADPQ